MNLYLISGGVQRAGIEYISLTRNEEELKTPISSRDNIMGKLTLYPPRFAILACVFTAV